MGDESQFPISSGALIARLESEHRRLEEQLKQIDSHTYLTQSERMEYMRLKKMKLRTRDRIEYLKAKVH